MNEALKQYFTRSLVQWHEEENQRNLPWKNEKDPYKIWLSEIILQQTRAQQGLPYYLRFVETFPTITDMANAEDEVVFRLWQGLGYYNRCKNMLATARQVATHLRGKFPTTHEDILALKGIGIYTAAAIASFAYGLPYAVVDGNVHRVLSRYFAIDTPIDNTEGKKLFATLAEELLEKSDSARYNQAIMDLGATVCTPQKPVCTECPLQKNCAAYKQGLIEILPVKSKKLVVRKRYFHYLLLHYKDTIWIEKRTGKDIWENLHQPYLIELDEPIDNDLTLKNHPLFQQLNLAYEAIRFSGQYSQRLTHRIIETYFFSIRLVEMPASLPETGQWLTEYQLNTTAFPKTLVSFLKNNLYF